MVQGRAVDPEIVLLQNDARRQTGSPATAKSGGGSQARAASRKVAWRAPRKCWYRTEPAQVTAVANRAGGNLAAIGNDAVYDQSLAFLEAARRHIGNEA